MAIQVSRESIADESGQKLCGRCGKNRRKPGQRVCKICHAAYMRDWRAGKVEVLLTPEEWATVQEARSTRGRLTVVSPFSLPERQV